MIGEGGTLFDTTDPTDYGLMALGMAPVPGARMAAGAGKLRKLAKLKSAMNPKNMKIDKVWTGTDSSLTVPELLARAKTTRGLEALQPTKTSLEEIAEYKLFKSMQPLGFGLTSLASIGANLSEYDEDGRLIIGADEPETIKEIKELTQEEMEKMEQILAEIEREKAFYGEDVDAWSPENMNSNYAGGGQLMGHAQQLANAGRGEDTMLMHVTPSEVQGIASLAPGMMTTNPQTGLPEAGFLKDAIGFALPFIGAYFGVPPWLTGAAGAKLRGGDLKDMIVGAGTGHLMGKLGEGLSQSGQVNQALTTDPSALAYAGDAFTSAGMSPELVSQTIAPAIKSGTDPLIAMKQAGVSADQIGTFKDAFQSSIKPNINFGNIKSAGLGGLQDQLMTLPGLGTIAGTGLQATRDATRRWQQSILDREEQRKKEEEELYSMYPENIPYRGGGSLYKNRYINGNWG